MATKNMNPNSLANLKPPFQVGHAPLPGAGRPRKRPITEEYDDLVREPVPVEIARAMKLKPGTTWGRAMAIARAREALQAGGTPAAKEMREAIEGKATQRIELSRSEERASEFVVVYATAIPGERIVEKAVERIIEERIIETVATISQVAEDDEEKSD